MDFEHSFTIPVPPEVAWDVLLDVERVAPCMPGATVDSVDGDHITGHVRVKVGPIVMTYAGKARFVDRDPAARTVTIEASGKESRGTGTASATVHAALHGDNGQTRVTMSTSLNVTGRPAQMGRGVLADVSGKLIERFAANLAELLAADAGPSETAPGTATATAAGTAGPAGSGSADAAGAAGATEAAGATGAAGAGRKKGDEALNLLRVAAWPVMKRIVPAIAALLAAAFVVLASWLRRRRRRGSG